MQNAQQQQQQWRPLNGMVQPPPRRARPAAAAEQGPLDWLVPFIPPFLRVNRDTRAAMLANVQSLNIDALAKQIAAFLKAHGKDLAYYTFLFSVWVSGLVWVDRNAPEFASAYVIVTGMGTLFAHLFTGERTVNVDGISAYSVFNKGGARMLGSLSAEQFEVSAVCVEGGRSLCWRTHESLFAAQNEIRHRQPNHGNNAEDDGEDHAAAVGEIDDEEEHDP